MARHITLRTGDDTYAIAIADDGDVRIDGGNAIVAAPSTSGTVRVGTAPPRTAWVAAAGDVRWVFLDGQAFRFEVETVAARTRTGSHHGSLSAPMPATVLRILAQPGAAVKRGDTLIILEAMKMELPIRAGAGGVVTEVRCREGEFVQPGTILIEIDEAEA